MMLVNAGKADDDERTLPKTIVPAMVLLSIKTSLIQSPAKRKKEITSLLYLLPKMIVGGRFR
jgi:hypothetical protein